MKINLTNKDLNEKLEKYAKKHIPEMCKKSGEDIKYLRSNSSSKAITHDDIVWLIRMLKESITDEIRKTIPNFFNKKDIENFIKVDYQAELGKHFEKTGTLVINMEFSTSGGFLQRKSLNPKNEGIDNILELFSTGYEIPSNKRLPVGTWHGNYNVIALRRRRGSQFLQRAVIKFNSQYGSLYNCYAEIDQKYNRRIY